MAASTPPPAPWMIGADAVCLAVRPGHLLRAKRASRRVLHLANAGDRTRCRLEVDMRLNWGDWGLGSGYCYKCFAEPERAQANADEEKMLAAEGIQLPRFTVTSKTVTE